jgi:RNA polymerase sigma-70 factor, ECF subfamily
MSAPSSDEDLMLRYRDGDASAFETLYGRHKGGLYRYLLRSLNQPALAEELFQEVWTSVIRSRGTYSVSAKFSTYLYRIAHNRLIDQYRAKSGTLEVSLAEDDETSLEELHHDAHNGPEQIVMARQQAANVLAALEQLPLAQRETYMMFEEAQMSLEDIAAATGVNRETAKSRLRYAFNKLRRVLET